MYRFLIEIGTSFNPLVQIIGLGIAVWAFLRSRKRGYLVVAIYFTLAVFSLLVLPPINRVIRAHHPPDVSEQTEQKINAAEEEAGNKVLADEGHPVLIAKQNVRFPFGSVILVFGSWLVARRELGVQTPSSAQEPTTG